ncbi:Diaminopimelate epimerase-like protein [Aspergillus ellipticus CBS 707.79]|uniref:trans-L-3-hydroxyproline dehydratase n=1 Tax=Aspergillus ellipticus CBS 707.79 TaxID=1448320 RepID=A0A319CTA7_9EURO|nr:Diaminopimelate epimerase-like protein [Aspergillus ellipticus CBS 707.79]
MDLAHSLDNESAGEVIRCIDMHTTGEPVRIVYAGFPALTGETLLAQREQALKQYDHLRRRILLEPRGHYDMYGAIIRPSTELVESEEAHVGVLYAHNGGFGTMCGHATLALGRFLVDTQDPAVFPKRHELAVDPASGTVMVNLHAPCGIVRVTVPVVITAKGEKSDPSRPVSFLSPPAYATATQLPVSIPPELRWSQLGDRDAITIGVSYGGTYFAIVDVRELGLEQGLKEVDLDLVAPVLQTLKAYLNTHPDFLAACQHPPDKPLPYPYAVMVVDSGVGVRPDDVEGTEAGLCFFADNQIDRSPTGSCVVARMALAYAKGERRRGQRWAYNSLVSNHFGTGAFVGGIVETGVQQAAIMSGREAVVVRVEGGAYYTGTSSFIVEAGDSTSHSGFSMKSVMTSSN